ncbi:MAG: hypothetical protein K2W82_13920 [Candidatus Obscuribacterales bacterium]|nr:hypothetical protein [Candidatus Obscuribacterales bacterium]
MKPVLRKVFSLLGATVLLFQSAVPVVFADESEAGNQSGHSCHHEENDCQTQAINLDLSSTTQSVTANCISNPVSIDVGGTNMAVTQGMVLTPAQLIVAYQVARGGQQSLLLGADGAAVGGSFVLGNHLANYADK